MILSEDFQNEHVRKRLGDIEQMILEAHACMERTMVDKFTPGNMVRIFLTLRLTVLYINELIAHGHLQCVRTHGHRMIDAIGPHLALVNEKDLIGIQWHWTHKLHLRMAHFIIPFIHPDYSLDKAMRQSPQLSTFCSFANDVTEYLRRMRICGQLCAPVCKRVEEAEAQSHDNDSESSTVKDAKL